MNSNLERMEKDLLYILGYISGRNDNDITPFEGQEEQTIRECLKLVEQENEKIKNDN